MDLERLKPQKREKLVSFERASEQVARYLRNELYSIKSMHWNKEDIFNGQRTLNPFDAESVTRFLINNRYRFHERSRKELGTARGYTGAMETYVRQLVCGPRRNGSIATTTQTDGTLVVNPDLREAELAVLPDQHLFTEQRTDQPVIGTERKSRRDSKARITRTVLNLVGSIGSGTASSLMMNAPAYVAGGVGVGAVLTSHIAYRSIERGIGEDALQRYGDSRLAVSLKVVDREQGALHISNEKGITVSPDHTALLNHAYKSASEDRDTQWGGHEMDGGDVVYKTSPAGLVTLAMRLEPNLAEAWVDGMDDQVRQLSEWTDRITALRSTLKKLKLREKHTGVGESEEKNQLAEEIIQTKTKMHEMALSIFDSTVERYNYDARFGRSEKIREVADTVLDSPDSEIEHPCHEQLMAFRHLVADIILQLDEEHLETVNDMKRYVDNSAATFTEPRHMQQIYIGFYNKYSAQTEIPKWPDIIGKFGLESPVQDQ